MYKDASYLKKLYIDEGKSLAEIGKLCGVTSQVIYYYVLKFGLTGIKERYKRIPVNESSFSWHNPLFCYYAGLVATDGYLDYKNMRVSLRVKNKGSFKVLTILKHAFSFEGEIRHYNGSFDISIPSIQLFDALKYLKIEGLKSGRFFCGETLSTLPLICQQMFIRGILDGDGSIHSKVSKYTGEIRGGQFRISMLSERFIQELVTYLNKTLDMNYAVKFSGNSLKKHAYAQLEMRIGDSKKLYAFLYAPCKGIWFKDKYEKYCSLG